MQRISGVTIMHYINSRLLTNLLQTIRQVDRLTGRQIPSTVLGPIGHRCDRQTDRQTLTEPVTATPHKLTLDVEPLGSLDEIVLLGVGQLTQLADLGSFQELGHVINISQPVFPPHE